MKKVVSLFLCISLIACLAGCTPSGVRNAQKAIDAIGEVSLDSIEQVEEANSLYDALNDEEKGQVENYATLEKANERLSEVLFAEIKIQIDDATKLENGFFAQYYDTKKIIAAKKEAQDAVDNSDSEKYVEVYKALKSEVDAFNTYIKTEQEKSFSKVTGEGDYPFAVEDSNIEYAFCLAPYVKQSSDYPVNPCFFESDTTDERPIFHFEMKNDVCVYSYELKNVETKWIEVQDADGNLQKAFVNTEIILYDAPDSWMPNNELYPLGEGSCYLFVNEDKGVTLAIKDVVTNKGYVLYSW